MSQPVRHPGCAARGAVQRFQGGPRLPVGWPTIHSGRVVRLPLFRQHARRRAPGQERRGPVPDLSLHRRARAGRGLAGGSASAVCRMLAALHSVVSAQLAYAAASAGVRELHHGQEPGLVGRCRQCEGRRPASRRLYPSVSRAPLYMQACKSASFRHTGGTEVGQSEASL